MGGSATALCIPNRVPAWAVEIAPAMAFSTGLLVLGLVLVGFAGHCVKVETPAAPEWTPDEAGQVVNWVREFWRRHGRLEDSGGTGSPRAFEDRRTATNAVLVIPGPGTSRFRGFVCPGGRSTVHRGFHTWNGVEPPRQTRA
jgi:hypothetical protein